MNNHHISVPKADLILAMDELRLSGRDYSADLLKKALFSAPVSAEPVAQVAEDFIFFLRKQPNGERWPVDTKLYAAPIATPVSAEPVQLAWRVVDRDTGKPRTDWIDGPGGNQDDEPVFSSELIQRAFAAPVASQAEQSVSGADDVPSDAEFDGWAEDLSRLGYESNREGVEAYLRKLFSDRAALAQQDADKVDATPPSAHNREMSAIGRAIERVAESLPEMWAIQISIEAGAGTVHLIYPDSSGVLIDSGEPLSEQINEAYDQAIDAARKEQA